MIAKRGVLAVAILLATIEAASAQGAADTLVGSRVQRGKAMTCVLTNLSPTTPLSITMATVVDSSSEAWKKEQEYVTAKHTNGLPPCFRGPFPNVFTIKPNKSCYISFIKFVTPKEQSMLTCKMFVSNRVNFRGYAVDGPYSVSLNPIDEVGSVEIE